MHEKIPTNSMYFRDDVYSEPIRTVNAECVGVYKTGRAAADAATNYFHVELGLGDLDSDDDDDDDDDEGTEYKWVASENNGDCGTWDERVYVERWRVCSS
jgi:hypothetical protein